MVRAPPQVRRLFREPWGRGKRCRRFKERATSVFQSAKSSKETEEKFRRRIHAENKVHTRRIYNLPFPAVIVNSAVCGQPPAVVTIDFSLYNIGILISKFSYGQDYQNHAAISYSR